MKHTQETRSGQVILSVFGYLFLPFQHRTRKRAKLIGQLHETEALENFEIALACRNPAA